MRQHISCLPAIAGFLILISGCRTGDGLVAGDGTGIPEGKLIAPLFTGFPRTGADGKAVLFFDSNGARCTVIDLYTRKKVLLPNTDFYDSGTISHDGFYVAGCEIRNRGQVTVPFGL
jgi:hypothetical protein